MRIGEDIILYVKTGTFHTPIQDGVEITEIIYNNKKVYNNDNNGYYWTDENGKLTIPNITKQTGTYTIKLKNKNNKCYNETRRITVEVTA